MSDTIAYRARPSVLRPDRTWQVSDDALLWSDAKGQGQMAFADIDSIAIQALPQLGGKDQRQCVIRGRGAAALTITNMDARTWYTKDDRSEAYARFVGSLVSKAAAANPAITFRAGSSVIWWAWLGFLVLAAVFILMFVALLAMGIPITKTSVGPMVVMLLMLPGALRGMAYGRSRSFDPTAPPTALLSA